MIIRQTTTIVFEYPQDYLQEQEWCKTKDDRWIHKSTDTLGAVYENTISYSIGQPSNSEKPNNCETKPRKEQNLCGKCRYLYRDFKYGLSCYRLMDNEPCKYEERKDEPQTCGSCYYYSDETVKCCDLEDEPTTPTTKACGKYEPKDEPTISKMEQVEDEPQTEGVANDTSVRLQRQ